MPPISQSRATQVVIQTDFANVVESETGGFVEVEVTRDADGVMRFYSDPGSGGGGGVTVMESAYGNPIIDIASTSFTSAYSVTLPANTLPGSKVQVRLLGYVVQNSGSTQNVNFRIRLGGVTIYEGSTSYANSSTLQMFELVLTMTPRTTGGQFLFCDMRGAAASTSTTGYGNPGSNNVDGFFGNPAVAADETTSLSLDTQLRFQTSAKGSQIRIYHTETQLVPYVP